MKQLPKKFFVRTPTLELYRLAQEQLFKLGVTWYGGPKIDNSLTYGENMCLGREEPGIWASLMYGTFDFYTENGYTEVPIADLYFFEIPKKEITINILPWTVVIRGDEVDIGCRKNIKLGEFKTLCSQLENGDVSVKGVTPKIKRHGFYAEGVDVPWELWDKFMDAFNKALA